MSELIDPALQDYIDGVPVIQICLRHYISAPTLWRWRVRAGIPQRPRLAPIKELVRSARAERPDAGPSALASLTGAHRTTAQRALREERRDAER